MPFKSKAQQRWMFAAESRGELPKGTAREWAHETKDIKKLPERKHPKESKGRTAGEMSHPAFRKEAFWDAFGKEAAASTQALKRLGKLGVKDADDFLKNFSKTQTTHQGIMKKAELDFDKDDPIISDDGVNRSRLESLMNRRYSLDNDGDYRRPDGYDNGYHPTHIKEGRCSPEEMKRRLKDPEWRSILGRLDKDPYYGKLVRTKEASGGGAGLSALELVGLGTLAIPSIQGLRGKKMKEHHKDIAEVAGLGILAAPYAKDLGGKGLSALKPHAQKAMKFLGRTALRIR